MVWQSSTPLLYGFMVALYKWITYWQLVWVPQTFAIPRPMAPRRGKLITSTDNYKTDKAINW